MQFHDEQLVILKELFLSYQQTPNEKTFLQILERVDQMLTETIGKFSRVYHFNEPVPQLLQDMYQTGIIGLKTAIDSFNPEAKHTSIPIWIFYQVRNELIKMYWPKKFNISKYRYLHPDQVENSAVDSNLIQEDVRQVIQNILDSKKLSEDDIQLLVLKYVENLSISNLLRLFGNKWGSRPTLTKRLKKISRILKKEFEEKGFGSE